MQKFIRFIVLVAASLVLILVASAEDPGFKYPETRIVDHVDAYHGTEVADPYRWLENDVRESEEVADWVERQNAVTFGFLESLPGRDRIEQRLTELWDYERRFLPRKTGERYLYSLNDGLQNQPVLYVADTPGGEGRVLLDPNTWSEDGTVALAGTWVSDDGTYVAYGVSEAGSDWRSIRIVHVETGEVLADELRWIKHGGSPAWTKDNAGFFYGRYDEPEKGRAYQDLTFGQRVYYHRVGTPQSQDVLVYQRPEQPTWGYGLAVTEDGRYLVLTVSAGTDDRYRVMVRDLAEPYAAPVDLIDNFDHKYSFAGNDGPVFYFETDRGAPNTKLAAIDLRNPDPENATTIIAESEHALRGVDYTGGHFIATYLEDAKTRVKVFTTRGEFLRDVELPGIGSAGGFYGKRDDPETFYSFSSYATPPSIYRYDVSTGKSERLWRADVDFNPDEYAVEQVFYESKDGTRIPMFLTHKKGLRRDGNNCVLLFGYGGFNIPLTPSFSVSRIAWVELGGVYAIANLRGGGEYGEAWHEAGTKLDKQNVFDDFIAAAEWLIENRYTTPERLAIHGRSNGGLLVGATLNQRPELFGAALPAVGVMDMLRFQKFTAGRFWTDDYGSSDNPEEFEALLAYSPYHNIRPGTDYPPTLVTTADTDDRVVPGHSFKYAARLQAAQGGGAPVLIRIETRAGHGGGKPTTKLIEEIADQYAFVLHHLAVD